ncbi:MAG: hypothetical protein HXS48_21365 [Theionarchaea archaeon]|nr:hypothetical protein [Theionarchaea archaeon]
MLFTPQATITDSSTISGSKTGIYDGKPPQQYPTPPYLRMRLAGVYPKNKAQVRIKVRYIPLCYTCNKQGDPLMITCENLYA